MVEQYYIIDLLHSLKGPIMIFTSPVQQVQVSPRATPNWTVPTITNTTVYVAGIESLKLKCHFKHILLRKEGKRWRGREGRERGGGGGEEEKKEKA